MDLERDLARIVKLMVDRPEEVRLDAVAEAGEVILELRVAADDLGKVIGRQGRTARALRSLLGLRTAGQPERHELEIVEED